MKTPYIFTILLFVVLSGFAQTSSIDFVIKNLGFNVDGHFNTFTINAKFNGSNALESLQGEIDVTSIQTGIDKRNQHLLEDTYFYTSKYPKITLASTKISKQTKETYSVVANLNIKGKSKEIIIPVRVETLGSKHKVTSEFEINRRDFNVGGGSFVMSKTVKIKVTHFEN